jgi:hypothetical protein
MIMTSPTSTSGRAFQGAAAAVMVVIVTACACFGTGGQLVDNRFTDERVNYTIGQPGEAWRRVQLETADLAWFNSELGAGLIVNSACEGVQDAPLVGLTNELLIGTTEREILKQELRPFSKREALETIVTGKLDGVLRKRALFVVKKDGCVYDIVFDAPPEHFEAGLPTYRRVRDGMDIGPRQDRS